MILLREERFLAPPDATFNNELTLGRLLADVRFVIEVRLLLADDEAGATAATCCMRVTDAKGLLRNLSSADSSSSSQSCSG